METNNSVRLRPERVNKIRSRLISTSLIKTPIIDENLKDYHEHKLLEGQDPYDLKYQLYAVVVSFNVSDVLFYFRIKRVFGM